MANALGESWLLLRPYALWLLPLALGVAWQALRRSRDASAWGAHMDEDLYRYAFADSVRTTGSWWRYLAALIPVIGVLVMTGPARITSAGDGYRADEGWVIAIDASSSMLDTDMVGVAWFDRARDFARTLIDHAHPRPISVIVYSADAYTLVPYTTDYQHAQSALNVVSAAMLPLDGTRPDRVLAAVKPMLFGAGLSRQRVIFISDGVGSASATNAFDQDVSLVLLTQRSLSAAKDWADGVDAQIYSVGMDFKPPAALLKALQRGLRAGTQWVGINRIVHDWGYYLLWLMLIPCGVWLWRDWQ